MCACQCFTCASREVLRKSARLAYSFLFTLAMLLAWVSIVSVTALDALLGSGQADLSRLLALSTAHDACSTVARERCCSHACRCFGTLPSPSLRSCHVSSAASHI